LDQLLQHLLNGLLLGATYSLLGIGLTLVFGLMNVVNFAHGEFYTLGAYTAFASLALLGLPFLAAIPVPGSWYYYDFKGVRPWTWFRTWV